MSPRLETIIRKHFHEEPGEPCLWWHGTWWSRGALEELVEDCEQNLRESGFREGYRLALALPNSPLFLAATLAVWRLGGAVVPLNPQAGPEGLRLALGYADAFGVLAAKDGSLAGPLAAQGIPVAEAPLSGAVPVFQGRECLPDGADTAVVFFTSGTTGTPKAVPLTHGNLHSDVKACLEQVDEIGQEEVFLNALPNFHALGFTVCALLPLLSNFSQVLLPSFMPPEATLDAMRQGKVTVAAAVPTMIALLLGVAARGQLVPASLRLLISGGDRLPPRLDERAARILGVPVLEGYGLTETSPVLAVNPNYRTRKPGTVGPLLPGVEAQIRDPQGNPVLPGQEGKLWVRGPNVAASYFRNEALSAGRFVDGWFDTQDLVRQDEEGYLSIVARVSDIIIVGGFNVYPQEVESVLAEHPSVREVAVVGVPRSLSGEIVKAFVVPRPGTEPSPRELIAFCRERLPHYKVPRSVAFLDVLPRSSIGEILKRELKLR